MSNNIKKIAPSQVEITVDVDAAEWKKAQEKAFSKLASNVTIKGFRKGAAPRNLVASHIDPNSLFNEAINEVAPSTFGKAVADNKIRPYSQPKINVLKLSNTELELQFIVTLLPSVKLGEYKGLKAEKEAPSVTPEEVEESIKNQLSRAATLEAVDRPAQMGDTVTFDFKGFVDGKAFDGGEASNFSLELGSHQFVPGFEEGLVGVKPGEKKDVAITFPTNYVAELAGKDATFKCHVHEIKEKKIPELNDEAVLDLGIAEVKTVEELRKKNEADLLASKVSESNRKYFNDILSQIVANAEIEIAQEIINDEAAHSEDDLKNRVEQQGLTFQQYLDVTGQKEEVVMDTFRAQAEKNLKEFLALQQIGFEEKLEVSDEEVEAEYTRIAEQYKMPVEDVKKALEPQKDRMISDLRSKKIQDFVMANNQ